MIHINLFIKQVADLKNEVMVAERSMWGRDS